MAILPLAPGETIGILGGGQLGRMLAQAASRLGFDVAILEPAPDAPAGRVAAHTVRGAYDDPRALEALAAVASLVTFEFENVPAGAVAHLTDQDVEVAPNARALAVAQDRVEEKSFLNSIGVPTVAFAAADSPQAAEAAMALIGAPALMKTRREGYDGKGQRWVEHAAEAAAVFESLGGKPVIIEAPADFVRELSVIAARGRDGELAIYPMAENHHENGVLRRSVAPAAVSAGLAQQAERIAAQVLTGLDYVGVIGIELFELSRWPAAGQRDRAPGAQHWPLDHGRLRGRSVRTAHPRHRRLAARAYGGHPAGRDAEPAGRRGRRLAEAGW